VEIEHRVFVSLMFFINTVCFGKCSGITFVDSTKISVCHNKRIKRNKVFFTHRKQSQNYQILTTVKLVKGEPDCIRKREKTANDLFSYAVSTVREPIESFFNWINEKVKIKNAQKVRSTEGLLVHIFA